MKIWEESWWAYRLTRLTFKWRYIKFILFRNTEWDYSSAFELWDLKLTAMGYRIWNWGVAECNRNTAHRCWLLRKRLRDIENAGEKAHSYVDGVFKGRYGFLPRYDMVFDKLAINFVLKIPEGVDVSKREEMDSFYHSLDLLKMEEQYNKEALDAFGKDFAENIQYLWD